MSAVETTLDGRRMEHAHDSVGSQGAHGVGGRFRLTDFNMFYWFIFGYRYCQGGCIFEDIKD
jgi:hypothetical protein